MAKLIYSNDVFLDPNITFESSSPPILFPSGNNLGSLPTLYGKDGHFVTIVNYFFFDLKAVKRLKDFNSYSRALLKFWTYIEDSELHWDHFPPIKRLKPTYLFRSHLLTEVNENRLKQSTANMYINHVKQFYLWAIHEGYLHIKNENEAPFKIEQIKIKAKGSLAHIRPTITVDSSDLRIQIARSSQTNSVRSMSPLTGEDIILLAQHFPKLSEEFRLQCLLAIQCGLRIQEVSSLSIKALNAAYQLSESKFRYLIPIGPSTGVETKFSKERFIEISIELLTALRDYSISERRLKRLHKLNIKSLSISNNKLILTKNKLDIFKRCDLFEPLFISEQGNPVDKKVIGSRWTDLRKTIRLNHPKFHYKFHDLRATYGTYRLNDILDAGLQPSEALELLMGWLGHNHESTTWKYLKYLKRKEVFKEKFALLDSIMHEALGGYNE
ncbi:tyrosine-type recombinase/integrase [Shewanella baltica]|uniref:tyrosine-type recombinase/integrase n=1 Tax=Shewanella baltica TaxID=62322 RepID=UPI00217D1AA0|nr:tyrosine-type recombinase/integrase [Shewanella baltica]MCS6159815.1 tyrosine-type recombinase/integrase [Shewanella baltica]